MPGDDESLKQKALHLAQVEKLSGRQILENLGIGYLRLKRLLTDKYPTNPVPEVSKVEPYRRLLDAWYAEYPRLKATQIFERLRSYGFNGSYSSVRRFTGKYRRKPKPAFFALSFLPGEEAQIDWFYFDHPKVGKVAGFLYVLAYSRYAWGKFYSRTSLEFFLEAHMAVFEHFKGLARRHRYDNVKTVILRRKPVLEYNAQFLDFARHYGFSIHVCNPYSGNEKGRVERPIRDIRTWLYGEDFEGLSDLNGKFTEFLIRRNGTLHRSTQKTPLKMLAEERLLMLPGRSYLAKRIIPSGVSKTFLVEFDANRYSAPSWCAGRPCEILADTKHVEIHVDSKNVATHRRSFKRNETIRNPLHEERALERSPHFKMARILRLIEETDLHARIFIGAQAEEEKTDTAYAIFRLFKSHGRETVLSALRELHTMKNHRIRALESLLNLPEETQTPPVWPSDTGLLHLNYKPRRLDDYDPDRRTVDRS
ncbi:MAG: IS21 family transposase [Candidatus Omnitrophota bacterium]